MRRRPPVHPTPRRAASADAARRASSPPPPDAHLVRRAQPAAAVPLLGAAAIVLATLVAYAPLHRAGFIWDDDAYLTENHLVQRTDGLARIWFTTETPQYYPLTFTTFWLEHKLWGLNPLGYHSVNVLLHAINALLLWRVARRVGLPAPWFIAAAFALHPANVESVAWITERKNTLSGLFFFLGIDCYLSYLALRRARSYLAALGSLLVGLLSKTTTSMLAPILLFVTWYRQQGLRRRDLLALAPFFALGAAGGLWTAYLERVKVGAVGAGFEEPLWARAVLFAPRAFCFYAGKIAWPHPIQFVYGRWSHEPLQAAMFIPLLIVLLIVTAALLAARRGVRAPLAILGCCAALVFPASTLLSVYAFRYSFVADHFQYLASAAFVALFALLAHWAGGQVVRLAGGPAGAQAPRYVACSLGGAALLACGLLTARATLKYESAQTLWETTLRQNDNAWIAMVNLGNIYTRQERFDDAEKLYRRAQAYPLGRELASACLGRLLVHKGEFAAGTEIISRAAAERGGVPALPGASTAPAMQPTTRALARPGDAFLRLGQTHVQAGKTAEAIRAFETALRTDPGQPRYRVALGTALLDARRAAEAVEHFKFVCDVSPADVAALNGYVRSLTESGQFSAAIGAARAGLAAVDDAALRTRLVFLLAAAPEDGLRDGAQAARLAREGLQRQPGNLALLDALAAALAETGSFSEAAELADRAAEALQAGGAAGAANEVRARAARYRTGEAHRLPAGG
ncbi:MAG: hypothetical protein CHACPFDD_03966 [Phycisphaerae bacterium]|nr:hypothetical protein [Phycisphaerae bacterium]